jgi:NADH-quinone oxidoreductase subunit N
MIVTIVLSMILTPFILKNVKLLANMFFKEPNENDGTIYMKNASLSLKSIIGISVAITVLSVFFTNPLLETITKLVSSSGY